MRPSFLPRLINPPFDDPGLYISFLFGKRAVIFDIGDIDALSSRDILKISHIFISHTHMDHFVGFDRLLRLFLGREHTLYIFGPRGFIKNIEGKLAGYSWNLVGDYTNQLCLKVTEVQPEHLLSKEYLVQNKFLATQEAVKHPFSGLLYEEPAFCVKTVLLDHNISCLGFSITEQFHININKEGVDKLGLEIGPWLNKFKQALFDNCDPDSTFEVNYGKNNSLTKQFTLGDLADQIAFVTPGQKVAYIVDAAYTESNVQKMVELAQDADHLFIEAAFLEKDKMIAKQKSHLTARQAGCIAGMARVKQFTPFHFSPRYDAQAQLLEQEAQEAYESEMKQ